jgi:hypothetical protein
MTGISPLFPAFPKQMSILDRVNITVARHKNDYFKINQRMSLIVCSLINKLGCNFKIA